MSKNNQHFSKFQKIDLVNKICPEKLCLDFLPYHNTLTATSSPTDIEEYFSKLFEAFHIPLFSELLIKRYRNCVYFGQKVPKNKF